jgi:hypothetical protein
MANQIQDAHAAIAQAIGECLVEWALVEQVLTTVYCECVGDSADAITAGLSYAVFDSVISIAARLSMIDAALTHKNLLSPRWVKLKQTVRDKYNLRSAVAHCDIVEIQERGGGTAIRLNPFPTLSKINASHLKLDALIERKNIFTNLALELENFRVHLRGEQGRP